MKDRKNSIRLIQSVKTHLGTYTVGNHMYIESENVARKVAKIDQGEGSGSNIFVLRDDEGYAITTITTNNEYVVTFYYKELQK